MYRQFLAEASSSDMALSTTSLISAPLPRGIYSPSTPSDLRSPCPMINCLANHGFIPRDGHDARTDDLKAALNEVGLSSTLLEMFTHLAFLEHKNPESVAEAVGERGLQKFHSLLRTSWYFIRHPLSALFSRFGLRRPGQNDCKGNKCLNLDQLALHGAVEHDVSLSRLDYAQGDNSSPQPKLIEELLASSSDGGQTLTMEDLSVHRKHRITTQRETNPQLIYGSLEHEMGCGEIALILDVLGDRHKVRCDFVRAFFHEERLPIQEGWKKRQWWTLGPWELIWDTGKIRRLIGMKM